MIYIKIEKQDGSVSLLAMETAVYVYVQPENGRILRCIREKAQGILNADGAEIYQLVGKDLVPGATAQAQLITRGEYEELLSEMNQPEPDPEDAAPEIPEDAPQMTVLTRAELTAKVMELDEAIEMLLSGVTE